MKIIKTHLVRPEDTKPHEKSYIYNGLDACITAEVLEALLPQLDEHTGPTYAFSRALQGPCLEMRLRGVRLDARRKAEAIEELFEKLEHLETNVNRLVEEGVGQYGFNWKSPAQLQELFYDRLGIPPMRKFGKVTVNREALEKLDQYITARPIVRHLTAMRDLWSKIKVLKTPGDPDGRIRTSYNIAGTSTGRFSSSSTEFGTGGNLQNIEESLRSMFIADRGMKMAKCDAKSGESYVVGAIIWNLFKDAKYLDACESGDPHTATARIVWPDLGWTGSIARDKTIAERPYYRHHSYRFMCKKLGHGTNYKGKPAQLAIEAKVEQDLVEDFQPKYFKAYPGILRWHATYEKYLEIDGFLITLTGRKRYFFGRRDSPETLREAMAYDPQGSLADIVNTGMLQVWRARDVTLYMHDHDAITVQYPEEMEDEIIPKLMKQLSVTVPLKHGRSMTIPYDCQVGWNKGHHDEKTNPDGLRDYIPGDGQRQRTKEVGILDRPLRGGNRQFGKRSDLAEVGSDLGDLGGVGAEGIR